MNARQVERLELNVERTASLLFGGALGSAIYLWLSVSALLQWPITCAACAGLIAAFVCFRLLASTTYRRPQFAVPVFNIREFDGFDTEELLLTDAERLDAEPQELILGDDDRLDGLGQQASPLLLDDILAQIGPDARVVRLFDRTQMPTPGQLRSRIDNHLSEPRQRAAIPDASSALSEALAELRRSLR